MSRSKLEFGVNLPTYFSSSKKPNITTLLQYAREAEEFGFNSVFTADTQFIRVKGTYCEAFTTLSMVAAATKRIKIGTGVLVLPLREPVITAKICASLDYLSKGRLILGIGGGIYRGEFTSLGVDYDSRWDRTVEAIQILRKLWSAEKVSHRGRYYKFQNARIGPPPARGTIPILIGGAMEHVLERTARVADGWMASSHNHTTRDLKNSWRKIQQYAKNYGRHPESFMFAHNVYAHVSSSFKESLDETQSFFKELYGGSTPPGIGDREILGSPEDILEQVRVRVKLGIKHIIFQFPFNNLGKLRKFGREVMPLLKKHFK